MHECVGLRQNVTSPPSPSPQVTYKWNQVPSRQHREAGGDTSPSVITLAVLGFLAHRSVSRPSPRSRATPPGCRVDCQAVGTALAAGGRRGWRRVRSAAMRQPPGWGGWRGWGGGDGWVGGREGGTRAPDRGRARRCSERAAATQTTSLQNEGGGVAASSLQDYGEASPSRVGRREASPQASEGRGARRAARRATS